MECHAVLPVIGKLYSVSLNQYIGVSKLFGNCPCKIIKTIMYKGMYWKKFFLNQLVFLQYIKHFSSTPCYVQNDVGDLSEVSQSTKINHFNSSSLFFSRGDWGHHILFDTVFLIIVSFFYGCVKDNPGIHASVELLEGFRKVRRFWSR